MTPTRRRMAVAVLAVVGAFLSTYLLLYKLGFYGALVCGSGGDCSFVQASSWATFLGIPVAGWGVGWYVAVLGTAVLGLRPGLADREWSDRALEDRALEDRALEVLAAGGLLFTLYLTAIELFVLEAICRLCVASAVLVLAICGLVVSLRRG